MKNPEKTFHWIVSIIKTHRIPFAITGGLAAKSYGSPRPLNDIDIDIHDKDLGLIVNDVKSRITFGPARYRDNWWDLMLMTLRHEGQDIDISGGDTLKICDVRTGKWVSDPTDFQNVEYRDLFGLTVPVVNRENLMVYKSMLWGDHQLVDIEAIKNCKK